MLKMLNLRNRGGASPCVWKQHQLTKHASYKLPKCELKESKTVVLYDVRAHVDPCAYLPKWPSLKQSPCP